MHRFLAEHRDELIARCTSKAAARAPAAAGALPVATGVPVFLEQLQRTFEAEARALSADSLRIPGASGGDGDTPSEMGTAAATHGREMQALGFTVDQLVHDYGDLCQAITDLAVERSVPFSVDQFRTLNRCLDNAIANAVTEFNLQRDALYRQQQAVLVTEHLGLLVHELRNAAQSAALAARALETGQLPMSGATGGVLKRSLSAITALLGSALDEVRGAGAAAGARPVFPLAEFIRDAHDAAALDAASRGCTMTVAPVAAMLAIAGDRQRLSAALQNLLQNALKFTRPGSEVSLKAFAAGSRVMIEVEDQCGGLPAGSTESLFSPFTQRSNDRTGVGLGLSIARRSVQADGGGLNVRNLPGCGCVFTISLPRRASG